jgi:hypothetical protein
VSVDAAETIERLLADAELLPDPQARALARALAAAMVELLGSGMARVIDLGGAELARRMADDELVGSLLVLAGMHPDPAAARAARALGAASSELGSIGAVVDGVDATSDGVRVRLSAALGAAPDAARVRAMVEAIVVGRAPDCETVHVELAGAAVREAGFVPVDQVVGRLRVVP